MHYYASSSGSNNSKEKANPFERKFESPVEKEDDHEEVLWVKPTHKINQDLQHQDSNKNSHIESSFKQAETRWNKKKKKRSGSTKPRVRGLLSVKQQKVVKQYQPPHKQRRANNSVSWNSTQNNLHKRRRNRTKSSSKRVSSNSFRC